MSEPAAAQTSADMVKRQTTLTAQFALRGFEVQEVSDGFMVTRWNFNRHVSDLDSLERFARVMGAT